MKRRQNENVKIIVIRIIIEAGFAGRALQSKAAGAGRRRKMAGSEDEEEGGLESKRLV